MEGEVRPLFMCCVVDVDVVVIVVVIIVVFVVLVTLLQWAVRCDAVFLLASVLSSPLFVSWS